MYVQSVPKIWGITTHLGSDNYKQNVGSYKANPGMFGMNPPSA